MADVSTIGLDLAKHVFQAHGADAPGRVVFRKRLRRERVLEFSAGKPACVVAMEACGGAHYWGARAGRTRPRARRKGDAIRPSNRVYLAWVPESLRRAVAEGAKRAERIPGTGGGQASSEGLAVA